MNLSRRTFVQSSAAALLFASGVRAATATLARKPYLQRVQATSASVLWTTAEAGAGSVAITGSDGSLLSFPATMSSFPPSETQMTVPFYLYRADMTGLNAGTQYTYSVAVDGQALASETSQAFTTPVPGNFTFLAFGDSGADSPQQMALIRQMAAEQGIHKVLHLGDMAYMAGTYQQFETAYFGLNAPMMMQWPFFATPGNHEYETSNAAPYLAGHVPPPCGVPAADVGRYYSFDWGDAHFVSVDSNLLNTAAASRMLAWLDSDLGASGKFWKIVFLHHPPYPTGTHLDDPICALVQQNVTPIVERHGVQLVLSGHEHGYERSFPLSGGQPVSAALPSTTYVISGGGGGAMETVGTLAQTALSTAVFNYLRVDVTGSSLTVKATGLNGIVVDQFTISPPPVIAANSVVNVGDSNAGVAPGSLVSIYGQNLAMRPGTFSSVPLPNKLDGITVTANGQPVPLLYVSPQQINVQMPYGLSGQVTLQVTTPNGVASVAVNVVPVAPSILAVAYQNAIVSSTNPATPGGQVTVYLTGLGAPTVQVGTGQAPPNANPMAAQVGVLVGGTRVQPSYAGLCPGYVGLSQVNFAVPQSLSSGVYPLSVLAGTAVSSAISVNVASA